jgi:transposase
MIKELLGSTKIWKVEHLPIIGKYCDELNIIKNIDSIVKTQMNISCGVIVKGMIIDILSGRSPLYRLEEFFTHHNPSYLIQEGTTASMFNDSNVGRVLDHIYKTGTNKIFSIISKEACKVFKLDLKSGHYDTTSVNVWGEYDKTEDKNALKLTYGYSKDHRPDLKQFIMECLCVEKNIPVWGGCADGNASDKALNNNLLKRITGIMKDKGLNDDSFIYIADSAFVTEDNLKSIGGYQFITRLPMTYNDAKNLITEAVKTNNWQKIGKLAQEPESKKRPHSDYKGFESEINLYGRNYRAIVIHSSNLDKRKQKTIENKIKRSKDKIQKEIKKYLNKIYYCEADAKEAGEKINSKLHHIETEIIEEIKYKPGRPLKDEGKKANRKIYKINTLIEESEEAITQMKEEAGCFIMLTNINSEGKDSASMTKILQLYKEQHGVERNFSFLKDPLIVNDLFLKTPGRIEALGMILLIALLVWNLMERSLRKWIEENDKDLIGWDKKKTRKPTSFMMMIKFMGVQVCEYENEYFLTTSLTEVQQEYLTALNFDSSVFKRNYKNPTNSS